MRSELHLRPAGQCFAPLVQLGEQAQAKEGTPTHPWAQTVPSLFPES